MIKVSKHHGGGYSTCDFKATKEFTTPTKIIKEFFEDSVRYYETSEGKTVVADTYDKLYKVDKESLKKKARKKTLDPRHHINW